MMMDKNIEERKESPLEIVRISESEPKTLSKLDAMKSKT